MMQYAGELYTRAVPCETKEKLVSAYRLLAQTDHPDHGGDPVIWTLRTAAYNAMKMIYAKKRGKYASKGDLLWAAEWENAMFAQAKDVHEKLYETKETKVEDKPKFVFVKNSEETKEESARRYAREYAKFRYQDPTYRAKRQESSRKSHAKNK